MLPPHRVIRPDGTIVRVDDQSSIPQELRGLWERLKDWRILGPSVYIIRSCQLELINTCDVALLPMFFASNYFYAYQGAVNAGKFDGPTRAVIAALEGAGAIIGALIIGFFVLDANWFARKTRGWLGLTFVSIITIIVWSCGLAWQLTFTRVTIGEKINYKDNGFAGKGALFFFCESFVSVPREEILIFDRSDRLLWRCVLPGSRLLDHGRSHQRPIHPRPLRRSLQGRSICRCRRFLRHGRHLDSILERTPRQLDHDARLVPPRWNRHSYHQGDQLRHRTRRLRR